MDSFSNMEVQYIQPAFSDTVLPIVGDHVDSNSLNNHPFLITSSLPNIRTSPCLLDPINDNCNKTESSSNEAESAYDDVLRSASVSEESLKIEITASEGDVESLIDEISMLSKQACNKLNEKGSVSQMTIYPRANTPQPGSETPLKTITISSSGTLKPISRCASYVSINSFTTDTNKFAPQLAAESTPNIALVNNYPFCITSSLPNITASPCPVDPIHDNCNMVESSSNASESAYDDVLRRSASVSEESLEIVITAPEDEVDSLIDGKSILNKQACNGLNEESSVSQMTIYPRANTPQPGSENLLPTIIISGNGTFKPISRCASYVSINSFTIDTDKFAPQLAAESTPNISLNTSERESETMLDMSLNTSTSRPSCENETISVTDSKLSQSSAIPKANESLHKNPSDVYSKHFKQKLQTALHSNSKSSLQVLNCHQARNNAKQNKNISQFSALSKSSVSLHLTNYLTNDGVYETKPILYTSALSYSNIAINLAGKPSPKNGYLDENKNSLKMENDVSNEKSIPNIPDIHKKPDYYKKFLRKLLPTNCFCLDLSIFDVPNQSYNVNTDYFTVQNEDTKICESKIGHSVYLKTSSDGSPPQLYLEQYGYPKENIFDGCKCSIM